MGSTDKWECSSNGRAFALHAKGKGIDALLFHFNRRYRLMVRTLVFETSNPGSIPGNARRQKKCFLHSKKNNFIVWSQKPILIEKENSIRPLGLGVWFSLWVREVAGPIPAAAHPGASENYQLTAKQKTYRLKIYRRKASWVRILP